MIILGAIKKEDTICKHGNSLRGDRGTPKWAGEYPNDFCEKCLEGGFVN